MTQERAKKAAAEKAIDLIKEGMIVGLGTGSTAEFFIEALANKNQAIRCVASSKTSSIKAQERGLSLVDLNDVGHVDLYVDGADQIDPENGWMIKGGGGAHLREKILASASKKRIIIVDETKISTPLSGIKLPVEVLFYGAMWSKLFIESMGYNTSWRYDESSDFFLTDNGNVLLDILPPFDNKKTEELLKVPSVVDTGLFQGLADLIIVGHLNGSTTQYAM